MPEHPWLVIQGRGPRRRGAAAAGRLGLVGEPADRSARWFRAVLDKPVVLHVWLNDDR
ncbi:hypothetical protein ACWC0C_36120 [Streptomyces sp. NPDC001709]